jgi:hypothetical protein
LWFSCEDSPGPFSHRIAEWQRAALQDAFDNTSAEHSEGSLSYGFAHGRGNYRPDCFLHFLILAGSRLGML